MMKKLRKRDQIIIRKKIDGMLSPGEEVQFNELIETSTEARSFYQKEAIMHHCLEYNSSQIPEIDLSDKIIQAVKPLQIIRRPFPKKIQIFTSVNTSHILAYAAILMIGLILGSIATYFGATHFILPNTNEVSGTIAKPVEDGYSFNQAGTGIKVQNVKSGDFRMLIVDIETTDAVLCTIRDCQKAVSPQNVKLLFSDGNFQTAIQDKIEQSYLCSGKNVFLINNVDRFNTGSIRFSRKDKLIYEYKTNQGRY
jgi:hypothetical protein